MKRPAHDNRYCFQCHQTTRHEMKGISLVCPRCHSAKFPTLTLSVRNDVHTVVSSKFMS